MSGENGLVELGDKRTLWQMSTKGALWRMSMESNWKWNINTSIKKSYKYVCNHGVFHHHSAGYSCLTKH